jgi:hypothetical protein
MPDKIVLRDPSPAVIARWEKKQSERVARYERKLMDRTAL